MLFIVKILRMKIFFQLIVMLCFFSVSFSQTPSFSVKFRLEEIMYHGDTCSSIYTVSLVRCRLNEPDIKYTIDTSKVDWKNLREYVYKDLNCVEIDKFTKNSYVADYYFRNHDYAFESIIKINLYREKCGRLDTMALYFPVKISSFVTSVDFGILYFSPGIYDLTEDMIYVFDSKSCLVIKPNKNILPE